MPDAADLADALQAAEVARGLARITAAIPAGVPGECEGCGEHMPRLVDGRCGFCRDGRRPPLASYDRAAPERAARPAPPQPVPAKPKETIMPSKLTATLNLVGDPADAFRAFAAEHDLTQGLAAVRLVEQALAGGDAPASTEEPHAPALAEIHTDALLDELRRRFDQAGHAADLERDLAEANARVTAAEARLALIGGVISGHVQPPAAGAQ